MTERSDTINPKSGIQNPTISQQASCALDVMTQGYSYLQYKLTEGVQVREETFGLLFYNLRGPRLYFVPSKDLIAADFFNGRQNVNGLVAAVCVRKGWIRKEAEKRITMILSKLEEKGLIYEQSIC